MTLLQLHTGVLGGNFFNHNIFVHLSFSYGLTPINTALSIMTQTNTGSSSYNDIGISASPDRAGENNTEVYI